MAEKKQNKEQERKYMKEAERQMMKSILLSEMTRHVGAGRMVGMGALYFRVFGKNWNHRINDTRALRKLITECRRDGVPIVSQCSHDGGGYYLASAGSELDAYCRRIRSRALKILAQESRLRNMNMAELLGQIQLELGGDPGGAA